MDSDDEMLCCMMDKMDEEEDEENGEDWMDTSWAQPNTDKARGAQAGTGENWAQTHTDKAKVHPTSVASLYQNDKHKVVSILPDSLRETDKNTEPKDSSVIKRMLLNDNKAGMEGLDKEKINQIIHEASKGSKFYENERMKEEQMKKRIEEQKRKIRTITESQLNEGLLEADKLLQDFDDQRDLSHTIVHIDMDAFYAAVEMRDRPDLKDKPMAVGGTQMLSTSNYHARKFGVRAAMPGFIGKKLCPELILVPLNFDKYTAVSKDVRIIFTQYDTNFCPMSLDEAYLDITEHLEQRETMSDLERTFICRDRQYVDSENHCLCDLNEIARNHGSAALENYHYTDVYSYLMNKNDMMDTCSKSVDRTIDDKRRSEFFNTNTVKYIRDSKKAVSAEMSESIDGEYEEGIAKLTTVCKDLSTENLKTENKTLETLVTSTSTSHASEVADMDDLTLAENCLTKVKEIKRPTCPVCHKEFPPFYQTTFGLTDEETVHELRTRIEQKTRLTASAGIAPNMMLAKVCSDKNKPNGQYKVQATKSTVIDFVRNLPLRKISGIGKVSEAMLNALDVYTCTDLYDRRALLYHLYSQISFNYFMRICLGIGSTTVERDSERKSMSTERTFSELSRPADLYKKCEELCECLAADLREDQLKGKTVGLKIKTVKFEVKTKAQTVREYTNDKDVMLRAVTELLRAEIQAVAPHPLRLRLMGVRMSNLLPERHCGGKKQKTILGAFKKLTEKQKDKHEPVKSYPAASDFQHVRNMDKPSEIERVNFVNSKALTETTSKVKSKICEISKQEAGNVKVSRNGSHLETLEYERTDPSSGKSGDVNDIDTNQKEIVNKISNYSEHIDLPSKIKENGCRETNLTLLKSPKILQNATIYQTSIHNGAIFTPLASIHETQCSDIKTDITDKTDRIVKEDLQPLTHSVVESTETVLNLCLNNNLVKSDETGNTSVSVSTSNSAKFTPIESDITVQKEENSNIHSTSDGGNLDGIDNLAVQNEAGSSNQLTSDSCPPSSSDKPAQVKSPNILEHQSKESPTSRRTRSGLVITPNRKAGRSRRNSKKGKSVTYSCPICSKEILCGNLNEFNEHVDDCLEGKTETDVASATSVSVLPSDIRTLGSILPLEISTAVSDLSQEPLSTVSVLSSEPATSISGLPSQTAILPSDTSASVSVLSSELTISASVLPSEIATESGSILPCDIASRQSNISEVNDDNINETVHAIAESATIISNNSSKQVVTDETYIGEFDSDQAMFPRHCYTEIDTNKSDLGTSKDDVPYTKTSIFTGQIDKETYNNDTIMESVKPYVSTVVTDLCPNQHTLEIDDTERIKADSAAQVLDKSSVQDTDNQMYETGRADSDRAHEGIDDENEIPKCIENCDNDKSIKDRNIDDINENINSGKQKDTSGSGSVTIIKDCNKILTTIDGENIDLGEITICPDIQQCHNINYKSDKDAAENRADKIDIVTKPITSTSESKEEQKVENLLNVIVQTEVNIDKHFTIKLGEPDNAQKDNESKDNGVIFSELGDNVDIPTQKQSDTMTVSWSDCMGDKNNNEKDDQSCTDLSKAPSRTINTDSASPEDIDYIKSTTDTSQGECNKVLSAYAKHRNLEHYFAQTTMCDTEPAVCGLKAGHSDINGLASKSTEEECNINKPLTKDNCKDECKETSQTISESSIIDSIDCPKPKYVIDDVQPGTSKDYHNFIIPEPDDRANHEDTDYSDSGSKTQNMYQTADTHSTKSTTDICHNDDSSLNSDITQSSTKCQIDSTQSGSGSSIKKFESEICNGNRNGIDSEASQTLLVCPVCNIEQGNASLKKFNDHVDACLNKGTDIESEICNENVDSVDSEDPQTLLVCPVCNIEQRSVSLTGFNDHVDACLSKGTITEILRDQRQKGNQAQKRQSISPGSVGSSQPFKRRKTVMPQKPVPCRSIISFFKDK